GYYFARECRLLLVTSRHVVSDEPSGHFPDRLAIELHIDRDNMAGATGFSIPLYRHGRALWRQGQDSAGDVDVAVIEIERPALPATAEYRAFTPRHLLGHFDQVEVGSSGLVAGLPTVVHATMP